MSNQVDIIIQIASEVIVDTIGRPTSVPNELALRHLVFDVRTR